MTGLEDLASPQASFTNRQLGENAERLTKSFQNCKEFSASTMNLVSIMSAVENPAQGLA
ncbi:hypothetical protein [Leptolyngbya sp. O-77]|uniref:hypothetical protein n=1 Tax=Leptolyngbya sp. O-77 TaxID=1080068 RepID=UPI0012E3C342|nr:hypothetical protein [Leptolyngbya sp. O-77]